MVYSYRHIHCKKRLAIFPSPAGMSLTKLSLAGNNLIIPAQGGFGKWNHGKIDNLFLQCIMGIAALPLWSSPIDSPIVEEFWTMTCSVIKKKFLITAYIFICLPPMRLVSMREDLAHKADNMSRAFDSDSLLISQLRRIHNYYRKTP